MIDVITSLSAEIYTALVNFFAFHTVSLLDFCFSKCSLESNRSIGRMISRIRFHTVYLNRSSVGKPQNLVAIIENISLFIHPKIYDEFSDWIANISRITFILGSRRIGTTRKIPMTHFFRSKDFVFEIYGTIGFYAMIYSIKSGLNYNSRIGNIYGGSDATER